MSTLTSPGSGCLSNSRFTRTRRGAVKGGSPSERVEVLEGGRKVGVWAGLQETHPKGSTQANEPGPVPTNQGWSEASGAHRIL